MEAPQPPPAAAGKVTASTPVLSSNEQALGECVIISNGTADIFQIPRECLVLQTVGARLLEIKLANGNKFTVLWLENEASSDFASTANSYVPISSHIPIIHVMVSVNRTSSMLSNTSVGSFVQSELASNAIQVLANAHNLHVDLTTDISAQRDLLQSLLEQSSDASERHWAQLCTSVLSLASFTPFLFALAAQLVARTQLTCSFVVEPIVQRYSPEQCLLPMLFDVLASAPPCSLAVELEQRVDPLTFIVRAAPSVMWYMQLLHRGGWLSASNRDWLINTLLVDLMSVHAVRPLRCDDLSRTPLYRTGPISLLHNREVCCVCTYPRTLAGPCVTCQPSQPTLCTLATLLSASPRLVPFVRPSLLESAAQAGGEQTASTLIRECTDIAKQERALCVAALNGREGVVCDMLDVWVLAETLSGGRNTTPSSKLVNFSEGLLKKAEQAGHEQVAARLRRIVNRNTKRPRAAVEFLHTYSESHCVTLLMAAAHGGVEEVMRLLASGVNINMQDDDGNTPMHIAVQRGHLGIVQALLKDGAQVNLQNRSRDTPLQLAARRSAGAGAISMLVKAGADVNHLSCNGSTPLLEACAAGCAASTSALIAAGANLYVTDRNTCTPMIVAATSGHTDVIQVLLGAGLSPNVPDMWHDLAPLHVAARNGFLGAVRVLIAGGADVNFASKHGPPLILACNFGHADVASQLIAAGAQVNAPYDERTPLHRACRKGRPELVRTLLDCGANVNFACADGRTALHFAVKHDNGIVEMLLAAGANPHVANADSTPLFDACVFGKLSVVECLLAARCNVDAVNNNGFAPVHAAARNGDAAILELLLRYGACPVVVAKGGQTPLHLAAQYAYNSDVTRVLLQAGAIPDMVNEAGQTPLHLAALTHTNAAWLLIRAGANAALRDKRNETPADKTSNPQMVARLRAAADAAAISNPRKLA